MHVGDRFPWRLDLGEAGGWHGTAVATYPDTLVTENGPIALIEQFGAATVGRITVSDRYWNIDMHGTSRVMNALMACLNRGLALRQNNQAPTPMPDRPSPAPTPIPSGTQWQQE
jgi:hypothetical protein